jgi:peptide/nickel transport system substrate-binding protein
MKALGIIAATAIAAALSIPAASPATAQKSADTLRLGINNPFSSLSQYFEATDESSIFVRRVFESLVAYDEHNGKFVPILAKSWTRVNPTTIEFELRDDIVFHNGNKFDADDAVDTFNLYTDEKTPLRYKSRYDWVEKAEKLGPYKMRIVTKQPNAIDMGLIAYRYSIEDTESRKTLTDIEDYGRKTPYGTGIYKVVSMDANKGVLVERFDGFKGDMNYARAPVKRFFGMNVPDRQTQIAQLMTGGLDIVANVIQDQANELKKEKGIEISAVPSGSFIYFVLASNGKVNKAIADPKVREAMHMAIDRDSIIKYIVPGGEVALKLQAPCFPTTIGCKVNKTPPAFDREKAKKLLAEAGYPNGFDLQYVVHAPIKDVAIAISGDLLKIGIKATVSPDPLQVYRKKQGDGVLEAWSIFFPLGNHPDISSALDIWFSGERAAYFNNDKIILDAMAQGLRETDPVKRDAIYQVALDRNADMHYVLPISSLPSVYAHSKDVKIMTNQLSASERFLGDFAWK